MNEPLSPASRHGCAVLLGTCGVILTGPSGSGKSRLSHGLIAHWKEADRFARWIADDRFVLTRLGDKLELRAPTNIQGKAERRFCGIEEVDWQNRAIADLVVELVPRENLQRMPEIRTLRLLPGTAKLPLIHVPRDDQMQAIELINARIG